MMQNEQELVLFTPYDKQRQVIQSLEDPNIFNIVVVAGRQVGKTLLAMNMAIKWCIDNPYIVVYWVSPTNTQADKVYKSIKEAIIHTGIIKSVKGGKGDTEIIFKNKSKILFRSAESEDSLRGESVDYLILDEGAFIKKSTLDSILIPMLSVKGKKLFVITTPKSKNWVYDMWLRGYDEPKSKSFRFKTQDSPFANQDFIDDCKLRYTDKIFKQEFEAEFVDSASVFNNLNELMVLPRVGPITSRQYYAGVDIGLINDASVLTIVDSNGHMVDYYRWDNIQSPELIQNIIEANNKWKFRKILIENNNQGLVIFQELKRKINNIEEFNTNSKSKPELINKLIHLFNTKSIRLIIDEYFRIELEAFIFIQKDGKIKFQADSGFHDDCVMSLAMAVECYDRFNSGNVMEYARFF